MNNGSANKKWSAEDVRYLEENWGKYSIPALANHLGRSVNAIKVRANRLQLGPALLGGDYVTLNQLHIAVTGSPGGSGYIVTSWIKNRGLPFHMKKVVNNKFRVVYLNEFWDWAEKNRSFIDFSKMEPLALGAEPEWVAEQRKKDFQSFAIQRKDPWTPDDDSKLISLLREHKYGYFELQEKLQRSAGAIMRRCQDLGIKERPVRADSHGQWTAQDFEILANAIRNGEGYASVSRVLGRSEKAIRGKVYFVYLTENADKVRAMMGDHPWGYGAPEPTVRQGICLSSHRKETKALLSQLVGVLYHRTRELKKSDYDQYFQRAMCVQWDDLHGTCGAGCEDCDSCTEFERIQPQYCVRCGSTFYERVKDRRCARCRQARRKQAYRKYKRLNYGAKKGEEVSE